VTIPAGFRAEDFRRISRGLDLANHPSGTEQPESDFPNKDELHITF
jgi:hypothetical protein